MSKEKVSLEEKLEQNKQLNELYYNCTECSSSIEILSINEKEGNIEFKCSNNNHIKKISIKDYINKMKDYNDKKINNDICIYHNHNQKYECYCLTCEKHLCKECLKSRNHISHNKSNIIEIQPNKKELDMIKNIIEYYEKKIDYLKKEKKYKNQLLNDKLKESKRKIEEKLKIKIEENNKYLCNELKLYTDEYKKEQKDIRTKYINEMKLAKYKYEKNINKIKNNYKIINDYNNIIHKNMIETLDKKYKDIIEKHNLKIDNLNNFKILNEIIYNTYNMYNNNYYNAININNILINSYNNINKIKKDYNENYNNLIKIKEGNEEIDKNIGVYQDIIKNIKLFYEDKIIELKKYLYKKEVLENVKSPYISKYIFSYLTEKRKLEMVKYNNKIKNKLGINFINYIYFAGKYIEFETEFKGKEINYSNNLTYEGDYLNGKRNGKGKEYDENGELEFEGEYLNGKRNGNGKEYHNGKLIFEGK